MIVVNYFFYFIQATAPVASLFVTLQNNVTKVNNGKSVFRLLSKNLKNLNYVQKPPSIDVVNT